MRSLRLTRRTLLGALGSGLAALGTGCKYPGLPNTSGSRLYPARPSLLPGDTLTLHVSTPAPRFRIDFYRQGATSELSCQSAWLGETEGSDSGSSADAAELPRPRPDRDFGYTPYTFPLPDVLVPGVYIASLIEGDEDGVPLAVPSPAALAGKSQALFVVRTPPDRARSILYKLPLATYQAYNFTGGGSLYQVARHPSGKPFFDLQQPATPDSPAGTRVTLLRPGGGAGGDTWHQEFDVYDPSSPRNTFAHWDAAFIAWLERNGYAVDYCMDLDVHQDARMLAPYRLLVSAGHDEYWSEEQRSHTEQYLANGGNLAFFSGNTCWWRIHYVDLDTALVCNKHGKPGPDQWYVTRPEDSLIGVSYRNAGSWWRSRRTTLGYTVQHSDHWVYAGTELRDGDVFGFDEEQPLIGYECDGVPFVRDASGVAVLSDDATASGTPANFLILGVAELGREWPTRLGAGATLGTFSMPGGGTVFNAATTDWVKLLERDDRIAQITRNVLDRLGS
jgi:hypothetical protein